MRLIITTFVVTNTLLFLIVAALYGPRLFGPAPTNLQAHSSKSPEQHRVATFYVSLETGEQCTAELLSAMRDNQGVIYAQALKRDYFKMKFDQRLDWDRLWIDLAKINCATIDKEAVIIRDSYY